MAAPKPRAFAPLTIDDSNKYLDLLSGQSATIALGTYYSPETIVAAVQAALTAALANGWAVTFARATGRVTVTGTGAFSILFATGAHAGTSARDVLGFGAVDTPSGTSATGAKQHTHGWYSERAIGFDSHRQFEALQPQTKSLDGVITSVPWAEFEGRVLQFKNIPSHKMLVEYESASLARDGQDHSGEALERVWRASRDFDGRFRWWRDQSDDTSWADLVLNLADDATRKFEPTMLGTYRHLMSINWKCLAYVE